MKEKKEPSPLCATRENFLRAIIFSESALTAMQGHSELQGAIFFYQLMVQRKKKEEVRKNI